MKMIYKLSLGVFLIFTSSCAFFNDRVVSVAINSNPTGADIFIEGQNYGRTPAVLTIEPKNYTVVLNKEGYGSAQLNLSTWGTIRTDTFGNTTADGTRCLLDSVSVIFFFNVFTSKCADFKQKEYNVNIPNLASSGKRNDSPPSSMIGIGNSPNNMVGYYYDQNTSNEMAVQPQVPQRSQQSVQPEKPQAVGGWRYPIQYEYMN